MEELFLYKFLVKCGRRGDVEGLFISSQTAVDNIIGKYVNFGEALGKHSQVRGVIEPQEIIKLDVPASAVSELAKALGTGTISGYNPIAYWDEETQDWYDNQKD